MKLLKQIGARVGALLCLLLLFWAFVAPPTTDDNPRDYRGDAHAEAHALEN